MKDVHLCCDCLGKLPDVHMAIKRSDLDADEQDFLDSRFNSNGLIETYLCQRCYVKRFLPEFEQFKALKARL